MTIVQKTFSAGLAGFAAIALAGCSTSGESSSPPVARAPVGVEGTWIDAKGVALSTFAGGTFTTVDAQTGTKLATGTYIKTTQNSVEVTGTSLARANAPIGLNCLLVSTSQLNCTSADGSHFTFTRRA